MKTESASVTGKVLHDKNNRKHVAFDSLTAYHKPV